MKSKILLTLLIFTVLCFPQFAHACAGLDKIPDAFVDIQKVIPEVLLDIRYYGQHNFLGEKVDGYLAPKCYLTKEGSEALVGVQKELESYSLTLKIYDCYRPQRAVNHFVRWATEIENTKTKKNSIRPLIKEIYLKTAISTANPATAAAARLI